MKPAPEEFREMVEEFFTELKEAKECDRARAVIAFVLMQITDGRASGMSRHTVVDIICAGLDYAQTSMGASLFYELLKSMPTTPPEEKEARKQLFTKIGQRAIILGIQLNKENQKARDIFRNFTELLQEEFHKDEDKPNEL